MFLQIKPTFQKRSLIFQNLLIFILSVNENYLSVQFCEGETLLNHTGIIYRISCKYCTSFYTEEPSRTGLLRIQDHKRNYKDGELKSELLFHALDTDHTLDFENIDVLASRITNLSKQLCLECWHTGSQSQPLYEAKPIPAEYKVFM